MKQSRLDKNDLEYLADLGFEEVPVKRVELDELKARFSSSRRFFGASLFVPVVSLFAGVLIGFALYYFYTNATQKNAGEGKVEHSIDPAVLSENTAVKVISLDTVMVSKENFTKPMIPSKQEISGTIGKEMQTDSADIITSKPIDLSLLQKNYVEEEKLKFIINAPVFYLHDLKVTNYSTLYFKKNKFVRFSGLSAAYSNTNEMGSQSRLKDAPEIYLHEEIAQALLYFKKRQYDRAINLLNQVATFNESDLNCSFYLAMSYYYKKNYSKAVVLFDECIASSNNTFLQEAMFYKAVSLYEDNKREDAKTLFKVISMENEFYSEKARTYLND